jgi:16S rRNA (cytosine967-C5)-methyltransferase
MGSVSAARKAAFEILLKVESGRAHSDDLLHAARLDKLTNPDRKLTTALVLGVLRWQILLDERIGAFLERPKARLDPAIQTALRMGAFQLLGLDRIPPHAAIDQSVEIAKLSGHRYAARMVNAVLHRLETAGRLPGNGAEADSAVVKAHPAWMVERWTGLFQTEATMLICAHGQEQAANAVRLDSAGTEEELLASGIAVRPGILLNAARIVTGGDLTTTGAFREGRVRQQDEGSQLVAEIAGRGDRILDCCAAPGGKTLILAERNPGAEIVACEASPQRLEALKKRLDGLLGRVICRLGDAATLGDEGIYDIVLADAPCSGTGTLGRNPEIRHRLKPDELPRQAARQRAILRAALQAVKPGGRVVYSTCSLEPEENEEVVTAILAEVGKARVVPVAVRIQDLLAKDILTPTGAAQLLKFVRPEGFLVLLPGALGTDGFFVAVIEKENSENSGAYSSDRRSFS